jgi:hypothetical protein
MQLVSEVIPDRIGLVWQVSGSAATPHRRLASAILPNWRSQRTRFGRITGMAWQNGNYRKVRVRVTLHSDA